MGRRWLVVPASVAVRTGYAGEFQLTCRDRRGGQRWLAHVANGVTTAACDELNRLLFKATSPTARTFTFGIISAAGFVQVSHLDTVASHPGWAEFTAYSALRPTWAQTASSNGVIDSLATQTVTVSAGGSLKGLFLAAADLLYSTGETLSPLAVSAGDTLSLRYRVRAKARAGT